MDIVCDFAYRADGSPTPLVASGRPRSTASSCSCARARARSRSSSAPRRRSTRCGSAARTVNAPLVIAACLAAGAVVGVAWVPLVPVFGARSAESNDQPGWTRVFASPLFLAGVCAALFASVALRVDAPPRLAPGLILCAVLVGVTAVDLRYRIIPNRVVLPAARARLRRLRRARARPLARAARRRAGRRRDHARRVDRLARRPRHGGRQALADARRVPRPRRRRRADRRPDRRLHPLDRDHARSTARAAAR